MTVAGPTKTGKTVLLKRLVRDPAWIDGQGITSVDLLWERLGDSLGVYTNYTVATSQESSTSVSGGADVGLGPILKISGGGQHTGSGGTSTSLGVDRPIGAVVRSELEASHRAVIIDDFHFMDRGVQREVVRALKPLVLAGVPIVFVAISHRVQDVVTAEPDMTGRVIPLAVEFWSREDLLVIAQKGFAALNLIDEDGLSDRLTEESYGSPHLMQKFCRELCKVNGIRTAPEVAFKLGPPASWDQFFAEQVDEASADWFQRLLRGPQERGSARNTWTLKDGRSLDGYGLTLAALAATGPKLDLTKDEIKMAVDELVHGVGPQAHQTTRVLQHMTRIAAKRASEPLPTAVELDAALASDPIGNPDVQPVLEYVERGPASRLHVADPFFAFYLKWGASKHL